MITREEIEAKASEFEIHTSNVQRDYVFGWLLAGIYTVSDLSDTLVLKGGNCFRKGYFESTRFSSDLDFSTSSAIKAQVLLSELNSVCDFVEATAGVQFVKDRNRAEKKEEVSKKSVYQARLYFKDFYGNPETITISVRLDVTEFDTLYLPAQMRNLIHPYSDRDACSAQIRCVKLEELLAIKLKCLLQRRHVADLFDYVYSVFVNQDIEVDRGEIVRVFLKRTIFEPSPGAVRGLLLDLPFETLRSAWQRYIVAPVASAFDFDVAVENFRASVEQLFGSFRVGRYGEIAFFPAELRNPIIEAGANLTLLELEYDGYVRKVEPYSLVFKRRKDGVGQEYFYAYDRTGGRTSGPGIKAFLHRKIGSVRTTEEQFEPRWPVELSKAGEPARKGYFGRPFSGGRRKSGSRRRKGSSSGITYVIQCSYCSRRFPRKTRNTKMRKHKDKYGNPCYGRSGVIVDQR